MRNKQKEKRIKRKARSRAGKYGTSDRPRLTVHRSNNHIYAQIIDDQKGKTLAAYSDTNLKVSDKKDNSGADIAFRVGEKIAQKALKKKISKVFFDRSGYNYHGRVKQLAEGARKGGLKF
jgi:large subunit ribosomal protein L18